MLQFQQRYKLDMPPAAAFIYVREWLLGMRQLAPTLYCPPFPQLAAYISLPMCTPASINEYEFQGIIKQQRRIQNIFFVFTLIDCFQSKTRQIKILKLVIVDQNESYSNTAKKLQWKCEMQTPIKKKHDKQNIILNHQYHNSSARKTWYLMLHSLQVL